MSVYYENMRRGKKKLCNPGATVLLSTSPPPPVHTRPPAHSTTPHSYPPLTHHPITHAQRQTPGRDVWRTTTAVADLAANDKNVSAPSTPRTFITIYAYYTKAQPYTLIMPTRITRAAVILIAPQHKSGHIISTAQMAYYVPFYINWTFYANSSSAVTCNVSS